MSKQEKLLEIQKLAEAAMRKALAEALPELVREAVERLRQEQQERRKAAMDSEVWPGRGWRN